VNFTGLSEFLWFLLIFGALFAFTVWRQQRDRRRREERMAAMSPPVESEPGPVAAPLPAGLETTPDISWGRGPAAPVPPPEVAPDWSELPARAEAAAVPPWTPPVATRAPRRTAPAVRPPAVARRAPAPLRSAAGLRQAVIAMTVLGPCRALEPYGDHWPQQEPGGAGPAPRIRGEGA
jgi:hypothetical protein